MDALVKWAPKQLSYFRKLAIRFEVCGRGDDSRYAEVRTGAWAGWNGIWLPDPKFGSARDEERTDIPLPERMEMENVFCRIDNKPEEERYLRAVRVKVQSPKSKTPV